MQIGVNRIERKMDKRNEMARRTRKTGPHQKHRRMQMHTQIEAIKMQRLFQQAINIHLWSDKFMQFRVVHTHTRTQAESSFDTNLSQIDYATHAEWRVREREETGIELCAHRIQQIDARCD